MLPVALITGGSRGIGAATALLAAQRGYAVAVESHLLAMFEAVDAALGRLCAGTALEVAHAIVWLMGQDASYTTGALIDVTGGR